MKKSFKKRLRNLYSNVDIYLFDQLPKGRFVGCRTIPDVEKDETWFSSYETVRKKAAKLVPLVPTEHFTRMEVDQLSFGDKSFDAVISNAVLHFAQDESHFRSMLDELWRVVKAEGKLFSPLASIIGIEKYIKNIRGKRFLLPDKNERF